MTMSMKDAGKLGAIESAKTAKIEKQKRIDKWNESPKLCKACSSPIRYDKRINDFCNRSCRTKYTNSLKCQKVCLACSRPINRNSRKYCSTKCAFLHQWEETKKELIRSGVDESSANKVGKRYLIDLHGNSCQICKLSEWMGELMPLVLDHINGNPFDNSLSNLRVICHNCNAQTPTFTGRNKGNGRFSRAKRYKIEQEVLTSNKQVRQLNE